MTLSQNYIDKLDCLISYWAALKNIDQPLFWHERKIGQKQHSIKVKMGGDIFDFKDLFRDESEEIKSWFLEDFPVLDLQSLIEDYIMHEKKESRWDAVRKPQEGIVISKIRRPGNYFWNKEEILRHKYWNLVVSQDFNIDNNKKLGRSGDLWANELFSILNSKYSSEKENKANNIIRKIISRRPNWEFEASQSWRAWSYKDDRWSSLCDKWRCSYRAYQNKTPLALWAIENNWPKGVLGALKEMGVSPLIVQSPQDIPSGWWNGKESIPSGSLWHWACRIGSREVVESLLEKYPDILNSKDLNNRTALHWACANSNEEVVKYLSSLNDIDLSIEDNDFAIAAQMIPEDNDALFEFLENLRINKEKNKDIGDDNNNSNCKKK